MKSADQAIVNKLLNGDKRALRSFSKLYYLRLLAYVKKRVRSVEDAEEIVQDSFVSFLDALPLFSFRSSLWTFLVSIARHEIADYFRKLYAKKALKYVPFVDQVYDEPLYASKETRVLFYKALTLLKLQERQLVLWKYDQDLSIKEIADKLSMTPKATESRLFRARQAFKEAYLKVSEA